MKYGIACIYLLIVALNIWSLHLMRPPLTFTAIRTQRSFDILTFVLSLVGIILLFGGAADG